MSEREDFLRALQANEDDTLVRLAFADWLDELGEHEEADRQRKWPASKAWIIGFCEDHEHLEYHEPLTYRCIMDQALNVAASADKDSDGYFNCGNNMGLCYSEQWEEFWKHWSIVSGIPLAPEIVSNIRYSCSC